MKGPISRLTIFECDTLLACFAGAQTGWMAPELYHHRFTIQHPTLDHDSRPRPRRSTLEANENENENESVKVRSVVHHATQ